MSKQTMDKIISVFETGTPDSPQDIIYASAYFVPARAIALYLGIQTDLGVLVFYDAAVQHGIEGDDGVLDMLSRFNAKGMHEEQVLDKFLSERYRTLMNPKDRSKRRAWRKSVGRVECLEQLINERRWGLKTPFTISPFGDTVTII